MMLRYQRLSKTGVILLRFDQYRSLSRYPPIKYSNKKTTRCLIKFAEQTPIVKQSRCFSNNLEHESQEYESDFTEFLSIHDDNCSQNYFRNVLYPYSDDEIINKLKSCIKSKEVFDIINNSEQFSPQQLAQAVLVLRDFVRYVEIINEYNISGSQKLIEDFDETIRSPSFSNLVNKVVTCSSQMNLEELSCCILYLYKLSVRGESLLKLMTTYENILKNTELDEISLSSLARFCVPLKTFGNIWSLYTMLELLPILLHKLNECDNYVNLGRLTLCFQKMVPVLSSSLLDLYTEKCSFLLYKNEDHILELERSRTVIKVAFFLSFKIWANHYQKLMKQLILSLHGNIKSLSVLEIATLHQLALTNNEPYQILNEIHEVISQWTNEFSEIQDSTRLFYISLMFPKLKIVNNDELKNHLRSYLSRPLSTPDMFVSLNYFYRMLLNLDVRDEAEIADIYWTQMMKLFILHPELKTFDHLILTCLRYMKYNTRKRYSHHEFEKFILSWIHPLFSDSGKAIYKPVDFVKLALIVSFFEKSFISFTNTDWDWISSSISRFDITNNTIVSFLLKLTLNRTKKPRRMSKFLHHYIHFISALNNNALEYLTKNEDIPFDHINVILRGYNYREGLTTSTIFKLICDRCKKVPVEQMNSTSISFCISNFTGSGHLETEFANKVVEYCIREKNQIHGSTSSFVLNYQYIFGYLPNKLEMFLDLTIELLNRDREYLPSFVLIRTALALSYFGELPVQLIDAIFEVKFIENLGEEIQLSLKKFQIKSLRKDLMELNRTVCIEYPNREIPWFHEKYCNEQRTLEVQKKDFLHEDVLRTLKGLVNIDKSIDVNFYSPYNHKIDILLHTNRKGEPVSPDTCKSVNHRKIAILLNTKKTISPYYRGKGKFDLKTRQLEMLGYKVVVIDKHLWNTMYMSEPNAKENYLCSQIWSH